MKTILFSNKTKADIFNIIVIIYLLIFYIIPLQLLFLAPSSTIGLFFKNNFLLSSLNLIPLFIYFYSGVFL